MDADAARDLVAISAWLDAHNGSRDAEAITWARIAKTAEEHGEAVAAFIGATGQNPRKGVTHTLDDVVDELLDVAVTALGAVEHLRGNGGDALDLLGAKIARVAERARHAPSPSTHLSGRRRTPRRQQPDARDLV